MTETSKGWLAGFYAAARTARLESAGWITAAASLLWLPQAALVAAVIAGLLDPASAQVGPLAGTAGFAALGLVRAGLEVLAARWLMEGAEAALSLARRDLVAAETARAPKDPSRPAAAAVAALASEKLALLGPWLIRFRPAMLRARVVPLAILAAALPLSWVVVLIFVVSGPLIPVFMALVGMAAKEASARQLAEVGTLNTLLLERLQALVDIRLLAASSRVVEGFRAAAEDLRARTMA
ncbi:cysteine ABC transporter permease, partial [Candidatus Falkowbacteria bacterium]|nr:cysteine ABC transporter permease [Candidatus Falkowbacteria bacterium]